MPENAEPADGGADAASGGVQIIGEAALVAELPTLLGRRDLAGHVCLITTDPSDVITSVALCPLPERWSQLPVLVNVMMGHLATESVDAATLVGYGSPERVEPALAAVIGGLAASSITVTATLRVDGDRYWVYRDDLFDGARVPPASGRGETGGEQR
jgi:hypothetical protein